MRWLLTMLLFSCSDPSESEALMQPLEQRCETYAGDCIDLEASALTYDGLWYTTTGISADYDCSSEIKPTSTISIPHGRYTLTLMLQTESKMVFAQIHPEQRHLVTTLGSHVLDIDLGFIEEFAMGYASFYETQAFEPTYFDQFFVIEMGSGAYLLMFPDCCSAVLHTALLMKTADCWEDFE